ncbi:MAG: radical SAM protein [Myxococcales bacterium]|nr:radical SAM protein [Myxococcales bacterium]
MSTEATEVVEQGVRRPPPEERSRTERTLALDPAAPLRRISIELERRCNLACLYCYTSATADYRGGLDEEEVRFVVREAVACGARAISVVAGGEALLRRTLLEPGESCLDYANALGAYTYLYTNATLVTERAARFLAARDVTVVGKLNSLKEDVQDALAGVPGSARLMRRGIDELLRAGLADDTPSRLGLETIICRQNYDELPDMWRFMRRHHIVPEVEIATDHGRAAANRSELYFAPAEAPQKYQALFEELLRIDRSEFGFDWVPQPPFAAGSCQLHFGNVYVNDRGGVQPCAGIDVPYGYLRVGTHAADGQSLRAIVTGTEVMRMRNVRENIEGACRSCELRDSCYGCRAAAHHALGDRFAADPTCWRAERARRRLPLLRVVP